LNPRTRRLRRHRRAYAAPVRLALACAYWYLGSLPDPFTVDSPADNSDSVWDRESNRLARACMPFIVGIDYARALDTLRRSPQARDAARAAVRAEGLRVVSVHAFGPGWRALGEVRL